MKKLISTTAIAAISLGLPALAQAQSYHQGAPYNAHEVCKKNEDKRQIVGGLAGAVLGGIVGSQVSANGARTEGSAIGAVVGGLAGAGIADKIVDCDPVYPERPVSYGSTYPSQTHHTTTVSQPVYQDQVTYSSHPVYSQPSYGAGAVNYGTTYNTGSVTYPPYTSQPAQSYTVSSPTYANPTYSGQSYPPVQNYQTQSYQTVTSTPTYHTTNYTRPVFRPANYGGPRHYHGRYACNELH